VPSKRSTANAVTRNGNRLFDLILPGCYLVPDKTDLTSDPSPRVFLLLSSPPLCRFLPSRLLTPFFSAAFRMTLPSMAVSTELIYGGGLLFALSFPLRMLLAGTAAWMAFAHWITGT